MLVTPLRPLTRLVIACGSGSVSVICLLTCAAMSSTFAVRLRPAFATRLLRICPLAATVAALVSASFAAITVSSFEPRVGSASFSAAVSACRFSRSELRSVWYCWKSSAAIT
jgi:hypothetical protein